MGLDDNGKRLRFANDIRISLADEDGEGCDDNFWHHTFWLPGQDTAIHPLDGVEPDDIVLEHHWTEDIDPGNSDYPYELRYRPTYKAPL